MGDIEKNYCIGSVDTLVFTFSTFLVIYSIVFKNVKSDVSGIDMEIVFLPIPYMGGLIKIAQFGI